MHKKKVYECCPEETRESKKEGKDQESIQSSPHLTQNTNWKVTTSQLDITNESQEVSPFQAGDHMASINRRTWKHNNIKTEKCNWEVTGVQFFRLQIWTEISHSLGLQRSTANQIQLNEIVVLDMWQPKLSLEKQPKKAGFSSNWPCLKF